MRIAAIIAMLVLNVAMHVVSNVGFKQSAISTGGRGFLIWQAIGNVAGFIGVLALTFVMRFVPLSQALAFSWGLGFVAIEVIGARLILREMITPLQWGGVALVAAGLVLISLGRSG